MIKPAAIALLLAALLGTPAFAQTEPKEPLRVRVGAGAQITPSFPGSSETQIGILTDFITARGDKPFVFESPDESFGFPVTTLGAVEVGPAATFQGARRRAEMDAPMDEVGFSIEAGGFAQVWLGKSVRLRIEGRKGLTGHRAWVGSIAADYVVRDGDRYVFSIGPRVNLSDGKYQRAYFGVSPAEAARTGLPQYRPDSGVRSVSVVAGATYSITPRFGLIGFAGYERLVGDAGDSPFIAAYGSRGQVSAGAGLTYTFRLR